MLDTLSVYVLSRMLCVMLDSTRGDKGMFDTKQEGECPLDTARDLARFLNVSVASIRKWSRIMDLPKVRIGRAVRFDRAQVLAWQHAKQQGDK